MAYSALKVREIVDHAIGHTWSVPEFQRGFVWKATQVRDLAESLWLDYPIGNVLIWNSDFAKEAGLRKEHHQLDDTDELAGRWPAANNGAVHPLRLQALLVAGRRPVERHGEKLRYPLRY